MLEDLEIDLFAFLGVLEFALVLLVVAVVFLIRSKNLAARVRELQGRLKKAEDVPEPITFDQYLRDEVIRNQELIERAAASENDAEKEAAELFTLRKQFLEMEIDARALEKNPVEFQERLAAGMSELIEQLRPEPETVTETETVTEQEAVESPVEEETAGGDESDERSTIDTHDAEFNRLKDVINNQQDALETMRSELQAREHEIEDLDSILSKLDEFERQSAELQQCMAVLEQENERLKAVRESGNGEAVHIDTGETAQLSGLKSMVGEQQAAISRLNKLIQQLAPEAGKAKELQDAMENMRRSNEELNGCVAVLEDENAMLRRELEEIQAQMEAQEAQAEAAIEIVTGAAAEEAGQEPEEAGDSLSADEEKQQLEIKVQELEALVEFKDAAIEELEKQYSKLESKYLSVTGEQKTD